MCAEWLRHSFCIGNVNNNEPQQISCATRSGLTQTGSGWCMIFVDAYEYTFCQRIRIQVTKNMWRMPGEALSWHGKNFVPRIYTQECGVYPHGTNFVPRICTQECGLHCAVQTLYLVNAGHL